MTTKMFVSYILFKHSDKDVFVAQKICMKECVHIFSFFICFIVLVMKKEVCKYIHRLVNQPLLENFFPVNGVGNS